jgi:Cu/Ag efflux protein CusF
MKRLTPVLAAAMIVMAAVAFAQKPVSQAAMINGSAVIQAIDATSRLITLKYDDGAVETVYAGPEVKRFAELKVGDKVNFRYHESVVYAIQKPGEKPPAPETMGMTRSEGAPGGTLSRQLTTTVTITAIDPKVPSVGFTTEDGRKMSVKVENPKNIVGLKVGDKVQVTYTQALAISVEAAKAEAPKK